MSTISMTSAGGKNRIAAALEYLRAKHQFFEFDDQERVVHVGVSTHANADEIAAHVGNLRDLEKLIFYESDLTDKGLSHLAGLTRLRELSVRGARVTSSGVAHLGAMSQLEDLYIENVSELDFTGFTHIARLRRLARLSLNRGSFCDADLEPLAALCNLEKLSLSECEHVGGIFCAALTRSPLRELSLRPRVSDEGLARIAKLASLEELFLEGPFTDAGLLRIDTLANLEILSIDSPRVTSSGIAVLATLPRLHRVFLTTPLIGDDSIGSLLQCTALEAMYICSSGISESGIGHLRAAMPNCAVYDDQRDNWNRDPIDERDKDRPSLDSNTPFETLLAYATDHDLVCGAYDKINARRGHWLHAAHYSPVERVIMLVFHTANWLGGGFENLFGEQIDGDPDFRLTAEAYRIVGSERSYKAFEAAIALFPAGVVPCDPEERIRLYEAANKSAREAANREFWCDDVALSKKLADFIRRNAAQLGDLDAV